MARRSSDNYVRLNKKITNPNVLKELKELSQRSGLPQQEICYRWMELIKSKESDLSLRNFFATFQ